MTIRGTTLIGRLAALCTLLFAFTACGGGGGGGGGFLPPDVPGNSNNVSIATTALPIALENTRYTALVEAVGGKTPYAWAIVNDGGTGFILDNEGFLTGTAPPSGDYGISLRVTDDANSSATGSFVLTVIGELPEPLVITTPSPLTGAIEDKPYTRILQAVGGQGDNLWAWVNDGGSGLQLRDDGVLSGIAPVKGNYPLTVSVTDNTRTVQTALILEVTADGDPLEIVTSGSLPDGTVGERYAFILEASGGDGSSYAWTLVSNGGQSGLTLSPAGVLAGTPLLPGTFGFVFKVSDGKSTDQWATTLAVTTTPDPGKSLTITTSTLPAVERVLYAATVVATGGTQPYTWSGRDTSTPITGFIMDATSGVISGDTSNLLPGLYGYSVTVVDSVGDTDLKPYIITVPGGDDPAVQILTTNPLPDAIEGFTYSVVMQAVGGIGVYTWTILETLKNGEVVTSGPSFGDPGSQDLGILYWGAEDVELGDYRLTIMVIDDEGAPESTADIVVFELTALLL